MDEERSYGLVMPFVTVTPDGPHDAVAYVHGYEMGVLNSDLAAAQHHKAVPAPRQIHAGNRPQADLIAMGAGFVMEVEEYDDFPEWIAVRFTTAEAVDPEGL